MGNNLGIWKEFYNEEMKDWRAYFKDTGVEVSYENYMKLLEREYIDEWNNDDSLRNEEENINSVEDYIKYRFKTDTDCDVKLYDPVIESEYASDISVEK